MVNQLNNSFSSIEQVAGQYLNQNANSTKAAENSGVSFTDILKQTLESSTESTSELKFSKHASQRLDQRGIEMSAEQSERLENGVQMASEKGIKESLVIVDSLAFIVNIPNQTVVTAMEQSESMENIFTNIDGAVII